MKNLLISRARICTYLTALMLISAFSGYSPVQAQTPFKIMESSQISVNGTSNMHDWVMSAGSFTCEGSFSLKANVLKDIKTLTFSLPVRNLKSKENLLNTRAYKALKADQFPKIIFKLTDATVIQQQKMIKVAGILTIAGVSNPINFQTSYTVNGDEITVKGKKAISMSDYKIKAPNFMMGALKTGNDVTVSILLKMKN